MALGGAAAAKAILPAGESPGEAFRRVFNENVDQSDVENIIPAMAAMPQPTGALAGNNLNEQQAIANSMPPSQMGNTVVVQSNQNNSSNSSNTQVNQTAVRSHDEIAKSLTSSHSGGMI